MKPIFLFSALLFSASVSCAQTAAPTADATISTSVEIAVDAALDRHAIDPRIYGLAYATPAQLRDLNVPLHRMGGNNTTRYNWKLNADNRASDYFFESIAEPSALPGARGDQFITDSKSAGAEAMLTIPMIDWVAKLGPARGKMASFSVQKYGAQQKTDPYMPDAGNGLKPDGKELSSNDPNDANTPNSPALEREWVQHIIGRWGAAKAGGPKYFILDNEPGIWHETHRDVQPKGITLAQMRDKMIAYSAAIKAVDAGALVVGPEEWGWTGYLYSGADVEVFEGLGYNRDLLPDRKRNGGGDLMPTLLAQLKAYDLAHRTRTLDIFTLHFYPQGGEFGDDVSPAMQERRNRSTRALWDARYKDQTWIDDTVRLIPRMREWAAKYFEATPIGITEYNWGAENHINGATTQADIWGIFGRERLDLAARWTTPATGTPVYNAMKLFRNPDNLKNGFGETGVRCAVPNPDQVSSFAALRAKDGALTIVVINKQLTHAAPISVALKNFAAASSAQIWQLTAKNRIEKLPNWTLVSNRINNTVPAQSITLIVLPKR